MPFQQTVYWFSKEDGKLGLFIFQQRRKKQFTL